MKNAENILKEHGGVIIAVIIIVCVMIVVAVGFYFSNIIRCKKRKDNYDALFSEKIHSKSKQRMAIELTQRCKIYYKTFFFYQLLSKAMNMLCLILSVFSMVVDGETIPIIASMISLICIVIIIYINPGKRAGQYLLAWRLCDVEVCKIVCCLNKSKNKLYNKINKTPHIIKKAELILSSDEE